MTQDAVLIERRFAQIAPHLEARTRRLWAAAEAATLGFGGTSAVARATGVSRRAIREGRRELRAKPPGLFPQPLPGRARRPGVGRKKATVKGLRLLGALLTLVEPTTRGDLENPLRGPPRACAIWPRNSEGRALPRAIKW